MTNQKELSYQKKAVDKAIEHLQKCHEFKLQSPTGSGKTFIIAKFIDQYLENDVLNNRSTSFLFIAPSTGSLDHQGYEKITSYLKKDWVKGFSTKYIGTQNKKGNKSHLQNIDYFEPNNVYFIGWQMIKDGTRITQIDSERNNIYRVIDNTKSRNINVVLIIDEAHREVSSSKDTINVKNEILEQLDPYKIIKISATLEQNKEKPDYKITYDDVRSEAAIKQNVIISSLDQSIKGIEEYPIEEQLIISAIEKQKQIKQVYQKNKLNINPLILIQIPDGTNIDGIKTDIWCQERIEKLLEFKGYKKGFNYTIWLDKNKPIKDKEQLVNNQSPIDIIIFKQALAVGWDVPRANILVRIRDSKNDSFNIQTLGRILRNPFFKYYGNELIDNAYVFTNNEKYKDYIKEEIVHYEQDFQLVERSKTAQNSNFTINKILIKSNNFNEEELIEDIANQIIELDAFYNFFKIEDDKNILIQNVKIDTRLVVEHNVDEIEKKYKKIYHKHN